MKFTFLEAFSVSRVKERKKGKFIHERNIKMQQQHSLVIYTVLFFFFSNHYRLKYQRVVELKLIAYTDL